MTPIQQLMLGVGASKKTYMDDVFSTYLYKGNGFSQTITNGINLSGEGGLTWLKGRTNASGSTQNHVLTDTVRGNTKQLLANSNAAQATDSYNVTGFSSTGFGIEQADAINNSNDTYSSWTFRKAPGFFDIVTYTGNGTAGRVISHNLGCEPGAIFIKALNSAQYWSVWHRGLNGGTNPHTKKLYLNESDAESASTNDFTAAPTSTGFTVGNDGRVNQGSGTTYVAYLFAGGESTAATATSVEFDGSNDDLTIPSSTDFDFGSGDFTIECWIKPDSVGAQGVINRSNGGASSNSSWIVYIDSGNFDFYWVDSGAPNTWSGPISGTSTLQTDQWSHIAVAREGTKLRLFVNGILEATSTVSFTIPTSTRDVQIGSQNGGSWYDGHVSNVRIVKGTAVYTSSFRPPTEPLSNITNTKLLCCQGSSATSATVIPSGSITNDGSTASTDSPFDDPAAFTFGDSKEGIIKCGSYVGNATTGLEVNVGFEPQWVLVKNASASQYWMLSDSMRGIATDGNDALLYPNGSDAEDSTDRFSLTPTGFKVTSDADVNGDGNTLVYVAIRRPDGYVGKPAETGTDVFFQNMLNASGHPSIRSSNFAGDMGMIKTTEIANSWNLGTRLTQGQGLVTDTNAAEGANSNWQFDYMNGANEYNNASVAFISYLWKRHAGFDVVTWSGDDVTGRDIRHNLNAVPQMIFVKNRSSTEPWAVYHHGANGGTNPWNYYGKLNMTSTFSTSPNMWDQTSPTSTHFRVIADNMTNGAGSDYIAMLFASTNVSKVGSYTGNGSATERTITLGFQPRFIMVKNTDSSAEWEVLDTTRGWASGSDDERLWLNLDNEQDTGLNDIGGPTSTGFTITENHANWNADGDNYIYYAHA